MSKETVPGIFRFVSMLSLIFEKVMSKKNCPRYFQICKYTFNVIRNVIIFSVKRGYGSVWSLYVCFL